MQSSICSQSFDFLRLRSPGRSVQKRQCWPGQRRLVRVCFYGGVDRRSRPADQSTHTSARWLQYDPMLLQSPLSEALPCGAPEGVHGVQFICRAMLWFLGHRRLAGSRLPTPRVCCVPCVLLWHNSITLCVEPSCRRFSAHECSAGTRVAPVAKRFCLAGRVERPHISVVACR